MIKFLYTDIDGVLCLGSETKTHNTKWGSVYKFNKKAVEIYNEILEKTGAEIIISSDWRNSFILEQLGEIFEWQGVIKKPIGVTPNVKYTSAQFLERDRAQEILMHVKEHKPDVWVAIDDLNLQNWWTGEEVICPDQKSDIHFVLTPRWYEGIKQTSKKEEICRKLK